VRACWYLADSGKKLVWEHGFTELPDREVRFVYSGITAIGHHFHDIFISLNNHGVSRIFSRQSCFTELL
jgi:hypothetical protein